MSEAAQAAADSPGLPSHLPPLDGLRGIAILLVMFFHYEVRSWPWKSGLAWPMWAVIREGWLGVDLFFVLSGFLITGILFDSRRSLGYFRTFYMRRTLRIFPVYYAYLVAMFVVLPALPRVVPWQAVTPFDVQIWYWSYLSNVLIALQGWQSSPSFVGHFWSLAVEEQFYLVWPMVVLRSSRRVLIWVCLGCMVGALAVRAGLKIAHVSWLANYVLTGARMDSLAMGALVAVAVRSPGGLALVTRFARPLAIVGTLAFVALFRWRGLEDSSDNAIGTVGLSVIAFFFAGIIAVAVTGRPGSLVYRALTWRVLIKVGKYSYAMYVMHYVVRLTLDATGFSLADISTRIPWSPAAHGAYVMTNTLATFGLAVLSWRLIEAPFLRLKDRFAYGPRQ